MTGSRNAGALEAQADVERAPVTLPFVLASEKHVLVADRLVPVAGVPGKPVSVVVSEQFAAEPGGSATIAVGVLPFDRNNAAIVYLPSLVGDSLSLLPGEGNRSPMAGSWRVSSLPPPSVHTENIKLALNAMRTSSGPSALQKVVLARSLVCQAPARIDPSAVLRNLRKDAAATGFSVPLAAGAGGEDRFLIGASPELLISKQGDRIRSRPLAGSARRGPDGDSDRRSAEHLMNSSKERREHEAVVSSVLAGLAPYCATLEAEDQPDIVATATMLHLATTVEGRLKDPGVSVLELVEALHPTPAVCGTPRDAAAALIAELEPFDRGFYGGAVGWCDRHGDGDWYVAIRCAEIAGSTAQLFAGGGLVPGSEPGLELAETSAKFETLLRALGIDENGNPRSEERR